MPKSKSSSNSNEKKKRKLQLSLDSFQNIANLTGFDHDDDDDEADNNMGGGFGEGSTTTTTTMDDVMAQFQFQQQQQQQPSKGEEKDEDNNTKKPSSSATAAASSSSSSSRKQQQQQHHNNLNNHLLDFEKIELWNQAFVKWCSSSSSSSSKSSMKSYYQPGLLPNIDEEIARNFKVQELSTFLLNTKDDEGEINGGGVATSDNNNNNNNIKELRMPTFERWLLDSKFLEQQQQKSKQQRRQTFDIYDDPILPSNPKSDTGPSLRLIQELIDSGMYTNKSSAINKVQTLCRNTSVACYELISQKRNRYIKESPLRNGDRIIIEEQEQQEKGNNNNHQDNNNNNNNDASGGNTTMITILYKRKKWKKPFCFKINKTYYDNLKLRFDEIHNNNSNNGKIRTKLPPLFDGNNNNNNNSSNNQRAVNSFNVIILALLLRYSALSGGQLLQNLRGGGMQGSIHSDVFDVLREQQQQKQNLGGGGEVVLLEGFASPFNVCPSNGIFGSAFSKDLDWHFGSIGSFFDLRFDKIVAAATNNNLCCEVNPPFTPGIMNGMVDHIESSLRKAQKYNNNNNNDLTFVVIVPTATTTTTTVTSATSGKKRNKQKKQKQQHASITTTATTATTTSSIKEEAWKSFNKMISSPYFKRHIHLSARQHGYIEGSQHLRPTKYKQSTYDTSVLILQTTTTTNATNNTNLEELESKIKIAFTSKHEKEIMERREYEKKQRK